jgi:H+-transporting ATPase
MTKHPDDYASQAVDDTLRALHMDPDRGLGRDEVASRRQRYGANEIKAKEEPLWHRVWRRFWGPIPWRIEVAAILSALVQRWEDFIIIIIVIMLLVNAGLDFFQEHRALNALKALKHCLANEVIVLREGGFETVATRELVPGDIVKLRIRDIAPALVYTPQCH